MDNLLCLGNKKSYFVNDYSTYEILKTSSISEILAFLPIERHNAIIFYPTKVTNLINWPFIWDFR